MRSLIEGLYNRVSRFRDDMDRKAERISGIFNGIAVDRLPNGMAVNVKSAPSQATAGCTITIYSGGHDDPSGKEGLAHLLEHVIFESGRLKERIDDFKKRGGTFNARTRPHDTQFIFDCIADDRKTVEAMVRLAADMVFFNKIESKKLNAEKKVVNSERAMYRAEEKNNIARYLYAAAYDLPEERLRNMGTAESLAAISGDDLINFHARHYVPANARVDIISPLPQAMSRLAAVRIFDGVQAGPLPERPESEPYCGGYVSLAAQDPRETTTGMAFPLPKALAGSQESVTPGVLAAYLYSATFERLRRGDERHGYMCSAYPNEGLLHFSVSCVPEQAASMQSFMVGLIRDVAVGRIEPDRFSEAVAAVRFQSLRFRDCALADRVSLFSPYFTKSIAHHAVGALKTVKPDDVATLMRGAMQAKPTLAVIGGGPDLMSYDDFTAALALPNDAATLAREKQQYPGPWAK